MSELREGLLTRTWVASMAIAIATGVAGLTADVVANIVQDDEIPLPWSGNAIDNHVAAVAVGLLCVPLLRRRRRAIVQQAKLADAEAHLEEYRAKERASAYALAALRTRVRGCIAADDLRVEVQPIFSINGPLEVIGYEALARFADARPPDLWFRDAADAGLTVELELLAADQALRLLPDVPDECYLSVNASPSVLVSDGFFSLFREHDARRCVVELTEHVHIQSYDELQRSIERLRGLGLRLAVDDAGAGYASFRHILQLAPDIIKLDRDLIRRCNVDTVRRTLASALVSFATEIGATLVAEGVETPEELETLRGMGVAGAQGYQLGRPGPLPRTHQSGTIRQFR